MSQVEDVVKMFCEKVQANEPECLQYSYSTSIESENDASQKRTSRLCCRESYTNVDALLEHLANVGPLFQEFVPLVDFDTCDIHCPADQVSLVKKTPLVQWHPRIFFTTPGAALARR